MNNKVRFVKDVRITRDTAENDLLAISVIGMASIKRLMAPVLVARDYTEEAPDGLLELDFLMNESNDTPVDVDLDVEVVFRIKNIPKWIKGVKINAAENSDIELL